MIQGQWLLAIGLRLLVTFLIALALFGTSNSAAWSLVDPSEAERVLLVQFGFGFRVTRVKCCVRAEDVIGLDSKRLLPQFLSV